MSIGSCFSENIGAYLQRSKFQIQINPYGILYNPHSIAQGLRYINKGIPFEKYHGLFYYNGIWYSFMHHSRFANADKDIALKNINAELDKAYDFISSPGVLMITFGTAFVYYYHKTKSLVANCHKLPNRDFTKKRLSLEGVSSSMIEVLQLLKAENPMLKIILTLSPVRHIRDGIAENQVSKSILRLAIDKIVKAVEDTYYFPAYEIVLDELRDYRFYNADMVHPSEVAIEYIWEQFSAAFFDKTTQEYISRFGKLRQAMEHRPFQPSSKSHQTFLKNHLDMATSLQAEFPMLDFSKELAYFGKEGK